MSDEESANFSRVVSLVITIGTDLLRKISLKQIPKNKELGQFLREKRDKLDELKKKHVLTQPQLDLVTAQNPDERQFDISLLVILLRNICSIGEPVEGWNKVPTDDVSIAADLLRLKNVRDRVIAHAPVACLANTTFEDIWTDVHTVLTRLATHAGIEEKVVAEQIANEKKRPLDPTTLSEQQALDAFMKWKCEEECQRFWGQLTQLSTPYESQQSSLSSLQHQRHIEESANFSRLVSLVITIGTDLLRKIFRKQIPQNKELDQFLRDVLKELQELKRKHVLTEPQLDLLTAPDPDERQFDISLLVILLRNICSIGEPVEGWYQVPTYDVSIAADLLRLKNVRNNVIAHAPMACLATEKFEDIWTDVETVLTRLATPAGIEKDDVTEQIVTEKTRALDPTTQSLDAFMKWYCEEECQHFRDLHPQVLTLYESQQSSLSSLQGQEKQKQEEETPKPKEKHKQSKSRKQTAERSALPQSVVDDNTNNSNVYSQGQSIIYQRSPEPAEHWLPAISQLSESDEDASKSAKSREQTVEISKSVSPKPGLSSEDPEPTLPAISRLKEAENVKPGRSRDSSICSISTGIFSYTDASFQVSESDEDSDSEDERLHDYGGEYVYPNKDLDVDTENSDTTFYELSCRVHRDKDASNEDLDAPSDTQLLQSGLDLNQSYIDQFADKRESFFEWYDKVLDVTQLKSKLMQPEKYKRCTIQIEGSHMATCTPIDADSRISSIEISGRSNAGQVFNEDEVVVELLDGDDEKDKRYGCVLGTLNRRLKNVKHPVFVCTLDDTEAHLVRPMCKTLPKIHIMNKEIMETCPKQKKHKVELYDYDHQNGTLEFSKIVDVHPSNRDKYIFLVAYINWSRSHVYPRGAVLKILPYGDSLKTGLKILDLQHEVPILYNISTVKKLESIEQRIGDEPHSSLLKGRTDLTNVTTFTIDTPGFQDLDDALSIESHTGIYRVGIHIADVAAYVEKGDAIDVEAQERAMTFYPGFRQPRTMIPEPLSNHIISLLPGKRRLTLTVFFYLDSQGRRCQIEGNNFQIVKSVIRSHRKFTYREAQEIIETKPMTEDRETVSNDIVRLFKMAHEIRKRRLGNYMYALDLVAGDGDDDDSPTGTLEAHYLVEEFMIMANHQIAKCLHSKFGQTVPFQCQPPPSKESMEDFVKKEGPVLDIMLRLQDRKISDDIKPALETALETSSERNVFVQKWIWHAVESGKEGSSTFVKMDDHHPLQYLAYNHWLAIQERAVYRCSGSINASADGKHYSLDMYPYTHFTSPIRCYIDVVVHRQIHDMLDGRACSYSKAEVENVCLHVNSIKKRAEAYEESCKALQNAVKLKSSPKMINCFIDDVSDRGLSLCAPEMKHVAKNVLEVKFNLLNMGFKPEVITDVRTGCDTVNASWRKRLYDTEGFSSSTSESTEDRVRVLNQHPEAMCVPMHSWARILRCAVEDRLQDLHRSAQNSHAVEWGTGLDDVSTECKNSAKMKPNTKFSMAFTHGQVVKVHMTAEPQKGILSARPQMYNMTKNVQCCLQHTQDPVLMLTEYSTKYTQNTYTNIDVYIEKWIPLIEMDGATGAVTNEESCNINNLPIKFTGRKGSFVLPISFCEERNIELGGVVDEEEDGEIRSNSNGAAQSYDWLCLKYTMTAREIKEVKSACTVPTTNKVWIGHAQVSGVNRKKAQVFGDGTSQDGKIIVTFNLHRLATDLMPEKAPKFNVEILSKAEVDRMTESFLKLLPSTSCSLAQRIALNNAAIPPLDTKHRQEVDSLDERDLYYIMECKKDTLPRNNRKQQEAIDKALKSRFSLIHGPPGTGKTYMAIKLLFLFDKINSNLAKQGYARKQVLFCGPSIKSVDLVARFMLNRLCDLCPDIVRVYGRSIEETDFPIPGRTFLTKSSTRAARADCELNSIALHHLIRQKGKTYAEEINAIDKQFKDTGYEANPKLVGKYVHLVREASICEIREHAVILCTTAVWSNPKVLEATNVFQVIIDEAGMCPEPHCLVPIIATNAEQVVLIGDHKQLQPIIKCKEAAELGLSKSLFERYALCPSSKNVEFTMLDTQYRMNPQICMFPSMQFYDGKLKTDDGSWMGNTLSIWPQRDECDYPHVMINVEGEEKMMTDEGNYHSVSNTQEVQLVVKLYHNMTQHGERIQINIISQYNAQCHEIREALKKEGLVNVNVNTVVSSQGGEWDYVIFSTVRSLPEYKIERRPTLGWCKSKLGFITDPHQINVALTRARKGLIIVGNLNLLRCDEMFGKLIDHYEERGCIKTADEFSPTQWRNLQAA